ncbi:MAG: helix-turn-helix transcriptional regulator [Trueperaceae bacterium]|nr:helix-turn-helix transcriptional regulator [Trueperaceae bacterium]
MSRIPDTITEATLWTNAWSSEEVGRHIAQLRKAKGLRQAEFAELLGVSRTTLSALENGRSVSFKLAVKAVSYLGSRFVIVPKSAHITVGARDR